MQLFQLNIQRTKLLTNHLYSDNSNAVIYDNSCLGAYACAKLQGLSSFFFPFLNAHKTSLLHFSSYFMVRVGQAVIKKDSCHGVRSCMGTGGVDSTSVILSVDEGSCIGDARYTKVTCAV